MPSIRSSSRDRTNERGIALIVAISLAILYFGLMQLMLIDASRALGEANRFRARTQSFTLAENAAEMAAVQLMTRYASRVTATDSQGEMIGEMRRNNQDFEITGEGTTTGVIKHTTHVRLQGSVDGRISIDFATHTNK